MERNTRWPNTDMVAIINVFIKPSSLAYYRCKTSLNHSSLKAYFIFPCLLFQEIFWLSFLLNSFSFIFQFDFLCQSKIFLRISIFDLEKFRERKKQHQQKNLHLLAIKLNKGKQDWNIFQISTRDSNLLRLYFAIIHEFIW